MKTLKKYFIPALAAATLLAAGCNEDKQVRENENAKKVIAEEHSSKDSIEKVFVQTLWEIDRNLELVQEKQGSIMLGPGSPEEKGLSSKERIMRSIQVINSLVDENKQKIASLNEQVKKYKFSNGQVLKLIGDAQSKIKLQEENISSLKNEIAQKDNEITRKQFDMATLQLKMDQTELKNQMLAELSARYEKDVNTAYYARGTFKELKKEGILNQDKGPVSFVKKPKINTAHVPDSSFTKVDIREVNSIPVNAKKVKLLTYHPVNSYALKKTKDGMIESLEIKDPAQFWKVSKYMVMEVK